MRGGSDAIHRVVEHQSVVSADAQAIRHGAEAMSYRDLNQRANALARRLMSAGLRRGSHVVARLDRSPELVITLLAVLKTGSAYTWNAAGGGPATIWAAGDLTLNSRYERVDVGGLDTCPLAASPNLPVLVRGGDVACLLLTPGNTSLAISHEDVIGARDATGPSVEWARSAVANPVALWSTLMAGGTLHLPESSSLRTAA